MLNLSERNGTFSAVLVANQDRIDTCRTSQQVFQLVQELLGDTSLKKSAVEYGKKILVKLSRVKDLSTAWQILYNVILAGDSCGCFWSPAAENRKYR